MCIYIRYSMSIIEKVFHFNENQINVVKCNDDIWFKGRDIANALGYENPGKLLGYMWILTIKCLSMNY